MQMGDLERDETTILARLVGDAHVPNPTSREEKIRWGTFFVLLLIFLGGLGLACLNIPLSLDHDFQGLLAAIVAVMSIVSFLGTFYHLWTTFDTCQHHLKQTKRFHWGWIVCLFMGSLAFLIWHAGIAYRMAEERDRTQVAPWLVYIHILNDLASLCECLALKPVYDLLQRVLTADATRIPALLEQYHQVMTQHNSGVGRVCGWSILFYILVAITTLAQILSKWKRQWFAVFNMLGKAPALIAFGVCWYIQSKRKTITQQSAGRLRAARAHGASPQTLTEMTADHIALRDLDLDIKLIGFTVTLNASLAYGLFALIQAHLGPDETNGME